MANNFKNYVNANIGTSSSNVYIGQAATQATLIGMSIANLLTVPVTANVTLSAGGTTVFMVKQATIAPGGALVPIGGDQKLVVETGDYVQVQASSASAVDVIVSALEIT